MNTLPVLISRYIEARRQRLELEAQAAEIATERERPLQEQILALMAADGVSSLKLEGIGRVVRRSKGHYEIRDTEKLARVMLKNMCVAVQNGRPLTDAMLLQRRVSRDAVETLCDGREPAALEAIGLAYVEKDELSISRI
jgi:hypothetical protein